MSKEQLSYADIKNACDILRRDDGVGPKNYINEISWILFLKIFEQLEEIFENIADAKGKDYKYIIKPEYQWSSWARDKSLRNNPEKMLDFVRSKLFPYLQGLSGDYGSKIAQIFNALIQTNIRSGYNLIDVVDTFDKIHKEDFMDSHLLSHAYEEILGQLGSEGGWAGEYYTPRAIIKFLVRALQPNKDEKIHDPFAGSGGFLVETFNYIQETQDWDLLSSKEQRKITNNNLSGIEKKQEGYILGMMNMITHGILKPNIELQNTFGQDLNNVAGEYNKVLTNPPFGGTENKNIYQHYDYPTSSTEGLALQYVMKILKPGGEAGIILPDGQILFALGTFKDIREKLFTSNKIKYIISLPEGVFAQMGTGIKTICMIFEKGGNTNNIVYYRLNGKFTKRKLLSLEHMQPILDDMDLVDESILDKELSEYDIKEFNQSGEDNGLNFDRWIVDKQFFDKNNYDLSPKNPFEKKEIILTPKENMDIIEQSRKGFDKNFEELNALLKNNGII